MTLHPWIQQLTTVALVAGLVVPVPATARPQRPQTAVLQIRVTLVAAASSRCSVGVRGGTAGSGGGVTGLASDDGTSTLDIRCGSQSSAPERPDPPRVLASGHVSTLRADRGNVALAFQPAGEHPDDRAWTGIRPLVSYRTASDPLGTLLINVEY